MIQLHWQSRLCGNKSRVTSKALHKPFSDRLFLFSKRARSI